MNKKLSCLVAVVALVLLGLAACEANRSPVTQEVQNLRAFAKLYGYVRFFHPSDEASSIDWERFAILGARRVRGAADKRALKQALEELFSPIATTVQIYETGGSPPEPADLAPEDTTGLVTIAWQHKGVGLGSSGAYISARTNRGSDLVAAGHGFGTATQWIAAEAHRGREIRFSAAVRAEVGDGGGQGQLWLRIDRPNRQRGFFDNMDDRPVRSSEWAGYEITGEVAEDAEMILFGCFLSGAGKVWVDDVRLWTREAGEQWQPLTLSNPGFEKDDEATGWSTASPGYRYEVDGTDPFEGRRSLRIEEAREAVTDPLFERSPEVGEFVDKDLDGGLRARIPLALYGTGETTYGNENASLIEPLLAELAAIEPEKLTASDPGLRLGGVIIAWNVFQHFCPYFDVIEADWDTVLTESLADALDDIDENAYLDTLLRMIEKIQDGHGRAYTAGMYEGKGGLPFQVDWVESRVVITRPFATDDVQAGDVVVALDGSPATEVVSKAQETISGSPQWKLSRAMAEFGLGEKGSLASIRVDRGGEMFEVEFERTRELTYAPPEGPVIDELEDGVFHVDLRRADMPAISGRIAELAAARGVIFDLRGYPNGNHDVLRHLTDQPLQSAHWMVPQVIYPDHEKLVGYDRSGRWNMEPAEPKFEGRIVFLTNGSAISYAESVMGIVEHYRLGDIVGQPTAGANGNVNPLILPGGYQVTWTGMRVEKHDGSQHHLVGIIPTLRVERTIQGIREGRDEYLEAALELILGDSQ